MSHIYLNDLKSFCAAVGMDAGLSEKDAKITAEVLSETEAFGVSSHGVKNLGGYIAKYEAGGVDFKAQPEITAEGPAFAVLDANNCIGMVAGYRGMELAIEKAAVSGIAIVAVKNSCHFGAAGYYANMAAKKGYIGLCVSNVDPNMTLPGAKGMQIGNNPVAYALPSEKYPSIFFDVALSNVASLKVVQARKDGKEIPPTWIVDKDGLPTTDPSHYPEEGAMQPMAAHKGYGLAVMVDALTGLLADGCTSMGGDIVSWCFEPEKPNNVCQTFIAINPAKFSDDPLAPRAEEMAQQLRGAEKAVNVERIYTPGEIEWEKHLKAEQEGVDLNEAVEESLKALAEKFNRELKLF